MIDFQARSSDWDDLGPDEDYDQNQAMLLAQYHGIFDDEQLSIQPIRRKKPRREELDR